QVTLTASSERPISLVRSGNAIGRSPRTRNVRKNHGALLVLPHSCPERGGLARRARCLRPQLCRPPGWHHCCFPPLASEPPKPTEGRVQSEGTAALMPFTRRPPDTWRLRHEICEYASSLLLGGDAGLFDIDGRPGARR